MCTVKKGGRGAVGLIGRCGEERDWNDYSANSQQLPALQVNQVWITFNTVVQTTDLLRLFPGPLH